MAAWLLDTAHAKVRLGLSSISRPPATGETGSAQRTPSLRIFGDTVSSLGPSYSNIFHSLEQKTILLVYIVPALSRRVAQTSSWEGASATWIAENLLKNPASLLICLDTWDGGVRFEDDGWHMTDIEVIRFVGAFVGGHSVLTPCRPGNKRKAKHPEPVPAPNRVGPSVMVLTDTSLKSVFPYPTPSHSCLHPIRHVTQPSFSIINRAAQVFVFV